MSRLTHFDEEGRARMVDVTGKDVTERVATASGCVSVRPETLRLIVDRRIAKGDVLEVARLAGIMAAKRTSELIPLCHPLQITSVDIRFEPDKEAHVIRIMATVKLSGRTGAEMEALTAVATTALTIYDMCKAVDRDMIIGDIKLLEKRGGKSGIYKRDGKVDPSPR